LALAKNTGRPIFLTTYFSLSTRAPPFRRKVVVFLETGDAFLGHRAVEPQRALDGDLEIAEILVVENLADEQLLVWSRFGSTFV
jgi:hypothetical protein